MRSREALESLKELLDILDKKQLLTQARTVKQAINRIEQGTDLQETICMVCNEPVDDDSELLQCPACKGVAHRDQLLEWLHVKDYCPKCHKHIDEASFRKTRLADLSAKTPARSRAKKN
jgi:Zn finger protein HypA/HybF involved in hydrogenase expression